MANIQVKIKLNDTQKEGSLSQILIGNVLDWSNASGSGMPTAKNDGMRLLSWATGNLKFDESGALINSDGENGNGVLEHSYRGYVFGATDEEGNYTVLFDVRGTDITDLVFYGDILAGQYPIEGYINNDPDQKIYSNDPIWAITFDTPAHLKYVTFTKWKRANYNACITYVATLNGELVLDKSWLQSIESVSQSTGQGNELAYGLIANTASFSFIDRKSELSDFIDDGFIDNSNMPMSIWANGKQIQNHISTDSEYMTGSNEFQVEASNEVEQWQKKSISAYNHIESFRRLSEIMSNAIGAIGYLDSYIENWTKYYFPERFQDLLQGVEVRTGAGWEIIGTSVSVTPGQEYTITINYHGDECTPIEGYDGIRLQVLPYIPSTDGDWSNNEIAGKTLTPAGTTNVGGDVIYIHSHDTLSFTPNTDKVYIVLNFGYIADGQTVNFYATDIHMNGVSSQEIMGKTIKIPGVVVESVSTVEQLLYRYEIRGKVCVENRNAYDVIDSICKATQLYAFIDDNDKLSIISARPRAMGSEIDNAIIIPARNQKTRLVSSKILKNKYDGIKASLYTLEASQTGIYTSDTIVCCKETEPTEETGEHPAPTFVATQSGVNDPAYDVSGGIYDTHYWLQFKGSVDTSTLSSSLDVEYPSIQINARMVDYQYDVNNQTYTLQEGSERQETIDLIWRMDGLIDGAYTSTGAQNYEYIFNKSVDGDTLNIEAQIHWRNDIGSALTQRYYTLSYIMDFTFTVLCNQFSANSSEVEDTGNNLAEIPDSKFLLSNVVNMLDLLDRSPLVDTLRENILSDYENGIATGTITVICGDYYNVKGERAKTWANGEIIQVGDVVRIDKDNGSTPLMPYADGTPRLWRVTGRTFRYAGVPVVDLELQEINQS